MFEKRSLWKSALIFASVPLAFIILGFIVFLCKGEAVIATYENIGASMFMCWATVLAGFLYYLGYLYFDEGKLSKLIIIIAYVANVAAFLFTMLLGIGVLEDEGAVVSILKHDNFGVCLLCGTTLASVIWWMFARKVFLYLNEYEYDNENKCFIILGIYTAACWVLGIISVLVGAIWGLLAIFAAFKIFEFYWNGGMTKFEKFLVNAIFYLVLMIIGIVITNAISGDVANDSMLVPGCILCWVGVLFAFSHYLGWDHFAVRTKILPNAEPKFVLIGMGGSALFGLIGGGMLLYSALMLPNMGPFLNASFGAAFKYALYFTPFVFFMFRCPVYIFGYRKNWPQLIELTVLLAFPVACYILSVIFLLIGFVFILVVYGLAVVVLGIIELRDTKGFYTTTYDPYETKTSSKPKKLSSKTSCPGLHDALRWGIRHIELKGSGWSVKSSGDFSIVYNDNITTVEVDITVTKRENSNVADYEVTNCLEPKIKNVIRKYQSENPETRGVSFGIDYNISYREE